MLLVYLAKLLQKKENVRQVPFHNLHWFVIQQHSIDFGDGVICRLLCVKMHKPKPLGDIVLILCHLVRE